MRLGAVVVVGALAGAVGCGTAAPSPIESHSPRVLATIPGQASSLTVVGDSVYVGTYFGQIYRVPISGASPTKIAGSDITFGPIAHDGTRVYFVNYTSVVNDLPTYSSLSMIDVRTNAVSSVPFPPVPHPVHGFELATTASGILVWELFGNYGDLPSTFGTFDGQDFRVLGTVPETCIQLVGGRDVVYAQCAGGTYPNPTTHVTYRVDPSSGKLEPFDGLAGSGIRLVGEDVDGLVFLDGSGLYGYVSPTSRYVYATGLGPLSSCSGCRSTALVDGERAVFAQQTGVVGVDLLTGTTSELASRSAGIVTAVAIDANAIYWTSVTSSSEVVRMPK